MFKVQVLSKKDYPFAVELANTMNWNMAVEDFQYFSVLEPGGCFLLLDGSERLGIASCISYGKVGWFGNLIVKKEQRCRGGGSALLNHAISYLLGRGAESIGLYAYSNLVDFYGNFGFRADEDFSLLCSECLGSVETAGLPMVGQQMFSKINGFDRACFGGDRKRLLQSIILEKGNLSYYVAENDAVVGYVAATVYETMAWVGPLICQSNRFDVAVSLVKSVLANLCGKSVYVVVSKKDAALQAAFAGFGFKKEFFVSRMFLGKATASDCVYIAESLERG
jgi:hypothetical protein